jgi:hypothetical protein
VADLTGQESTRSPNLHRTFGQAIITPNNCHAGNKTPNPIRPIHAPSI